MRWFMNVNKRTRVVPTYVCVNVCMYMKRERERSNFAMTRKFAWYMRLLKYFVILHYCWCLRVHDILQISYTRYFNFFLKRFEMSKPELEALISDEFQSENSEKFWYLYTLRCFRETSLKWNAYQTLTFSVQRKIFEYCWKVKQKSVLRCWRNSGFWKFWMEVLGFKDFELLFWIIENIISLCNYI